MSTDQTPTKGAPPQAPDPIFSTEEVERILAFHGTPVAAQVLREVLGSLGRTAAYLARKQPKNRPEEFRSWNPPALRALAELCALYAPEVGSRTSELEPADADVFPTATDPGRLDGPSGSGTNDLAAAQAAAIAAIEQQVLAGSNGGHVVASADHPVGQAVQTLRTVLDAEVIPPAEIEMVGPERVTWSRPAIPTGVDAEGWATFEGGPVVYAPDQSGWLAAATPDEHAVPVTLPTVHRPDPDGLDGPPF